MNKIARICFKGRSQGVGEDHITGGRWGLNTGKIIGISMAQNKQTFCALVSPKALGQICLATGR